MNNRQRHWLPILLLAALLTSCAGGTSGSVLGSRESCFINAGSGSCEGTFSTLKGTYGKDIEDNAIFSGDAIDVEVQASVESGPVRISVESPGGEITFIEILSGNSGTLIGVSSGEFDGFEVVFEALEGEATDVTYQITYQVR
ncbi:MAG: hypothetical protein U9N80_00870 [Chloroflexota bacterium]|nr:hypothetical protein [Chloroflexota bacterium]